MPSVCRRIVVLLVVALLGVGAPVTAVHAQGAGDQQYEDPFGGDDSSGSNGSSGSGGGGSNSDSGSGGDIEPITPAPQTSGGGTSGSGSGTTGSGTAGTAQSGPAASPTSPAATGQLPNTGLDTRVLIIAGAVLVLAGLGLRLRNAPERF